MSKQIICVCGAGTMGSGIAQAAAQSGFSTVLYDVNAPVLMRAREAMEKSLSGLVAKGKISAAEKDAIWQRIQFTGDSNACRAGIIIEAVVERLEIKTDLLHQLAAINDDQCIFATNTSSLSVTAIAEKISAPERVAGMHFFNPATIMKLVEVVKTKYTSEKTIQAITQLAVQMGKTPVVCNDSPGFIVNRVARPFYIESLRIAEEESNNFSQVDRLMESAGFKMGPFRLMDLIGNDVNYAVSCSVYEQLNHPGRLKPSYIQEQYVQEKKWGRKSGEGYYSYNNPQQ